MTRNDFEAEIRVILTRLTESDVSDVKRDDDLTQVLGLDSLGRLELLSEMEEKFDVTIYDLNTDNVSTINDILDVVEAAMLETV
ncbi:acyl carrier protein [bacterium]|nr:acyl carrier protein [bacterium]